MKITSDDICNSLLKSPTAAKTYRDMRMYFREKGMLHESEAFTFLLADLFNELNNDETKNNSTTVD